MTDAPIPLSAQGLRRREDILGLALAESRRRRRRRSLLKGSALAVLVGIFLAIPLSRQRKPIASIPAPLAKSTILPTPAPQVGVSLILTDSGIIQRLSLPPEDAHVVMIGDNELLAALANGRHPAGLAYINGKTQLLFR